MNKSLSTISTLITSSIIYFTSANFLLFALWSYFVTKKESYKLSIFNFEIANIFYTDTNFGINITFGNLVVLCIILGVLTTGVLYLFKNQKS
jgi:uncharacterized membrane protein